MDNTAVRVSPRKAWLHEVALYTPVLPFRTRSHEGRAYTCIESMSTENTRAPSFANKAAKGRPTTSDLVYSSRWQPHISGGCTHRFITVIVLPYARSP